MKEEHRCTGLDALSWLLPVEAITSMDSDDFALVVSGGFTLAYIGGHSSGVPPMQLADAVAHVINTQRDVVEALADVLRMLEAAHRSLGMFGQKNDRIERARIALSRALAPANAGRDEAGRARG